ncbi:centrosomal protein of 126 kDa isoform X2 [Artibeus jamaicensis]|uniref:centrosomal protein of 126 kDa isoform X2 n=1 Tax=Artibeus jamaicensis TaxID=9417 RepID=UPI00235A4958|nr:centrosomal protein of 126 kDa isoform X2 [Artibeus jamaicensis]
MPTGRPGARSAVGGLGTESSDTRDQAPLNPRLSGGRHRPAAYLDMKIHLEKNLEEERQILLQQQKICRSRARKYFVESNRRKKAFEEKRKEQEEREYQIREQILQERKQKFEEVTEKFQRGHIPLSQRRRAVFQKPVPPLEEALKQIQESNLKSKVNFSSSYRPTINQRAIDNTLPSSLSKNDQKHQKHLLSKTNCDKEMNENSRTDLAANKDAFQLKLVETQKLLEDQHLSSLQKFRDEVYQITNSEILSSVDSLEAGEHEEIYLTLINKEPSTSIQQSSVFLKSANLQSTNLSCFDEDKLSFSKTQHINNWLINLDDPNTQNAKSFSDILSKTNVLPSRECFYSKEQNPSAVCRTAERATNTANNLVGFVCSPPIFIPDKKSKKTSENSTVRTTDSCSGASKRESPFGSERPTFKFNKSWNTPDSLTQEMATISDNKKYSKLTQENRTTSTPISFVPVATPLFLSPNTQSAKPLPKNSMHIKEINPVQCSDKLGELKDVKNEKIKYFNCSTEELPLFSDNFPAAHIPHNSDSKNKKQKITKTSASLSNIISNYDLVGQHKKMRHNIHERSSVRFLKSILKKESKYEHDYFEALVINQSFKLGNEKAEAIRDSIELTKEKGKSAEVPKTIKKLRWFDEAGDTGKNAKDNHLLKNKVEISQQWSQPLHIQTDQGTASNILSVPSCTVNSADTKKPMDDSVSENVAVLGGSGTSHASWNCYVSSDFNIAKQAWSASEKEESKSPTIRSSNSKTQKANLQREKAKVIRTKSAKVQSGFVYPNRKGTVIRTQSASKANTFLQAQGKLIAPHPPKSPSNIRSDKNIQVSQCHSEMPENSQNVITNSYFNSKHMLPTEYKLNQWNKESSLPLSHVYSDSVTVVPSLPYCSSECHTVAKINDSNSTEIFAHQDGTLYCTQRCPVYEESHHSVAFGPIKEESLPSWKRQHNILSQNEKPADSAVTRRKRVVGNKKRTLRAEKQNPGSVGQKCSEQMNNFGPSVQLSSSQPKQTTRGTSNIEEDSTSEFLMAENLVNSSVPEDEILSVMSSKQLQKPDLALNKTQQFNICALSAEEQKILQSLDRLNERLYYVQETICKNPSIKNTLQIIPFLNIQPRTSQAPHVGSRSQRKY